MEKFSLVWITKASSLAWLLNLKVPTNKSIKKIGYIAI